MREATDYAQHQVFSSYPLIQTNNPAAFDLKDRTNECYEYWEPDATVTFPTPKGAEVFVLDGSFYEGNDELRKSSWLRVPVNSTVKAEAGTAGARVWIKSNHLVRV